MSRVTGLIFDLSEVLVHWNRKELDTFLKKHISFVRRPAATMTLAELSRDHSLGFLSSQQFYDLAVTEITWKNPATLSYEEFRTLLRGTTTENEGVAELLARVRGGTAMAVISNTNEIHWGDIGQLPLIERFFPEPGQVVLSHKVHMSKPDPQIFRE